MSPTTPLPHPYPNLWKPQLQSPQRLSSNSPTISLSFSHPRRRRRPSRRNPIKHDPSYSSPDSTRLQFILDVDQFKTKAPISVIQRTLRLAESKLDQFVSDGIDAYRDLQSLVIVEPGSSRFVVSCSQSTIRFVGGLVLWTCVSVIVVRVLGKLGLWFMRPNRVGGAEVVRRRDRSLGGREVVVARKDVERSGIEGSSREKKGLRTDLRSREERKLPNWWPVMVPRPVVEVNREEYQREGNRVVQAIMDAKLHGKDVSEDDILELRRIGRKSGVQLSFGTENGRDSLYRLSAHYVINACCIARRPSVQIDGEDACFFLAGLASDLGLDAPRAATIVCAAVAARTRLWFLQAWALEMQSKHLDAMEELKKICLTHRIFPPQLSSPEMEMVARGLEKHLNVQDREFLLNKLVGVCGKETERSAAEALGLV